MLEIGSTSDEAKLVDLLTSNEDLLKETRNAEIFAHLPFYA